MQKSTIFIVMLAVIVIAVIGKLFAYDYLRQGWANIFSGSGTQQIVEQPVTEPPTAESVTAPEIAAETTPAVETPAVETPAETPAETQPSEVEKLIEQTKLNFEKVTAEQLTQAGFKNAKVIHVTFDNRIFQIVDVSDITNADTGEFNIADEKNIYSVVDEMQFQTQLEAEDAYSVIKKRILDMPGLTINESNQFGNASLFMNDPKRKANAFLIVRTTNTLYFYTYPKANHEFIKKLIILLNQ
ncbi:hypothetical protein HZA39_03180 [Candidatus Peregrinibacteria bacterium]|nr:hypothetical protein [Candidatus Peregrinibacteria bacterium]